jgi:AcrR family transcriptional regulator
MSKRGLFDHFGSKQELHLATVDRAGARADRPLARLMVVGCCGLPSPAPRS